MIYEVYPLFLLGKCACAAGYVIYITRIENLFWSEWSYASNRADWSDDCETVGTVGPRATYLFLSGCVFYKERRDSGVILFE